MVPARDGTRFASALPIGGAPNILAIPAIYFALPVDTRPRSAGPGQAAPAARPGRLRVASWGRNAVEIAAEAPDGGFLVLHDPWHPWWRATVDGRPVPILRANLLFRALALPPGRHHVAFTFERAKDPRTASLLASAFLEPVRSAEVLDAHTIRFRFVRPHAQALEDFWWAPVPRHLLADVPPDRLRTAAFNRRPVGSGPYRFVEWRPNERVVFERNPDFPEGLGGPPYLDRVVFRVIPESATMLTELLTGGVDVDIPLLPDQVAQVRANDALQLFAFPGRTVYYIGWNNRRPPFTRAAVRRALALGIDREQIVNALLFGHGTLATSTIPPWHPFYPEDVDPLPYDPAEAARLLAAEGWADRTGDGVREGPDGRPLARIARAALAGRPEVDGYFAQALEPGTRCWILNGRRPERLRALLVRGRARGTAVT